MAREEEVIVKYIADVEQYNKDMASMTESTEKTAEAQGDLKTSTESVNTDTKTTAKSIEKLSTGLKNSQNAFTKYGRVLVRSKAPVQLFAKAIGQSAIEADRLRLITEKLLLTVGASIGTTDKATEANKKATSAKNKGVIVTGTLTVAEKALSFARSLGNSLWVVAAGVIALTVVAIVKYVTALGKAGAAEAARINQLILLNKNRLAGKLTLEELARLEEDNALQIRINAGLATEADRKRLALSRETTKSRIEIIKQFNSDILKIENDLTKAREKETSIVTGSLKAGIADREVDNIEAIKNNKDRAEIASKSIADIERQKTEALENINKIRAEKLARIDSDLAEENAKKRRELDKQNEAEKEASLQREFAAFVAFWDKRDKQDRDRRKANLEELKKFEENKQKLRDDAFEEEQDANLKNQTAAQANVIKLALEGNEAQIDLLRALKEAGQATTEQLNALAAIEKTINQQRIEDAQMVANIIFQAAQDSFDKRQSLLNEEIDRRETAIERQAELAARGLANTLAFEEKRAADLRRQQQKEAEQAKKVKLLETFLNSLAEFSKTDPQNALNRALLQVALATAATAVFAEEGGIIGEIGDRSNFSRMHSGGGDVLLHAQTGEGILSRKEMDNLGHRNFHLLKDVARFPVRDNVFSMPEVSVVGGMSVSNDELIKEVKGLRKDIKNNRPAEWSVDKFGAYIRKSVRDGVTAITKGKLPPNRFS